MDEEGFRKIVGRIKDMIIRGGLPNWNWTSHLQAS